MIHAEPRKTAGEVLRSAVVSDQVSSCDDLGRALPRLTLEDSDRTGSGVVLKSLVAANRQVMLSRERSLVTYYIYVDRSGTMVPFHGTDEQLAVIGSFVLQRGNQQAVAKRMADSTWRAWERLPTDSPSPLGQAKVGTLLGEARRMEGFPHIWEAHQKSDGSLDAIGKPSPYGAGSLTSAVEELLRLH